MKRTRTFIAVETTGEVRRRAADLADRMADVAREFKWTAAGNLHWTLQFLGDVDDLKIPAVCNTVAEAAAEFEPFELTACGAGAFPSSDRPRTLWIGAGAGARQLSDLQAAIERRLKLLGYRGENRRFVPHLTVGRAGRQSRILSMIKELTALADFYAGSMIVDEVVVFASQLTKDGSVYEPLSRAPLSP
jgi:RNA 2',3'-cyclic 3'-phosphodiesterase